MLYLYLYLYFVFVDIYNSQVGQAVASTKTVSHSTPARQIGEIQIQIKYKYKCKNTNTVSPSLSQCRRDRLSPHHKHQNIFQLTQLYSTHSTYPNNQTHPAQYRRDESVTSQTSESFPLFTISQSSQLYNLSKFPIPSFGNLYKIYIRRVKVGNISIVAMGNLTQISNV